MGIVNSFLGIKLVIEVEIDFLNGYLDEEVLFTFYTIVNNRNPLIINNIFINSGINRNILIKKIFINYFMNKFKIKTFEGFKPFIVVRNNSKYNKIINLYFRGIF